MAKTFLINQLQCEIINAAEENANLANYSLLTTDNDYYTSLINTLDENAKQELTDAVALGHVFYKVSDISHYYIAAHVDDINIPTIAISSLENVERTPFANSVFENLYLASDNKEHLLTQIKAGKYCYFIYDVTKIDVLPDNAKPLLLYSKSESESIKHACENSAYYFLLNYVKDHPEVILKCLILAYLFYRFFNIGLSLLPIVGAQKISRSEEKKLDKSVNDLQITLNTFPSENILPEQRKDILEKNELGLTRTVTMIGYTSLEHLVQSAIIYDNKELLDKAIINGYDISKPNENGIPTLILAAEKNKINFFRHIYDELNINFIALHFEDNPVTHSLLITAIDHGHDELAKLLIQWGINIDHAYTEQRKTLLHYLAALPYHKINTHRIKQLLKLGANIDMRDSKGLSPVFIAGEKNNTHIMKIFLNRGCKTSLGTHSKTYDLLARCMEKSSLSTVEFLLQQGFDPYANIATAVTDKRLLHSHVPVSAAVMRGDMTLMKLLIKYNVDLNHYPEYAEFLMVSAWNDQNSEMQFFLAKHGVSTNKLMEAAQMSSLPQKNELISAVQELLNTINEWKEYRAEHLKNQKEEAEYFKSHADMDIDELSIPEFIVNYKEYKKHKQTQAQKLSFTYLFNLAIDFIKDHFQYYSYVTKNNVLFLTILGLVIGIFRARRIHNAANTNMENPPKQDKETKHQEKFKPKKEKEKITKEAMEASITKRILEAQSKKLEMKPKKSLPQVTTLSKKDLLTLKNKTDISNTRLSRKQTLFIAEKLLKDCMHEKDHLITKAFLLDSTNTYNKQKSFEIEIKSTHYQLTAKKLEANICKLQSHYNKNIEKLSRICESFNRSSTSKYIDSSGMELLTNCQIHLQQLIDTIDNNDDYDETAYSTQESIIESCRQMRENTNNSLDAADNLLLKNKTLKQEIETLSLELANNTISIPKSDITKNSIIEIKPKANNNTNSHYSIKSTASKEKKSAAISTKSHTNSKLFAYKADNPEDIKNDNRVIYLHELFLAIQNIINNNNVEDSYRIDATLYLLMKSSHLIAQLSHKYTSIIIPFKEHMYNLRNNVVHYYEQCQHNTDLILFLTEYFHIFDKPLANLRKEGKHIGVISIDTLNKLSEFMLSDNRYPHTTTIENCLLEISSICDKAILYYELGCKLQKEKKYEHAGPLHLAMHAIVLQLREQLKRLHNIEHHCHSEIIIYFPEIIRYGNEIAHNYLDEKAHKSSRKLEGREYYIQQDFSEHAMLDLMKKIKMNYDYICSAGNRCLQKEYKL